MKKLNLDEILFSKEKSISEVKFLLEYIFNIYQITSEDCEYIIQVLTNVISKINKHSNNNKVKIKLLELSNHIVKSVTNSIKLE